MNNIEYFYILIQIAVFFRTSSAKCFHHFFHSFHLSQSIIRGGKITPYYESYQHSLIILLLMYLNPKGEVKNKVKSIAMKLGIVKTEEDDYLDWKSIKKYWNVLLKSIKILINIIKVLECVGKYSNIDKRHSLILKVKMTVCMRKALKSIKKCSKVLRSITSWRQRKMTTWIEKVSKSIRTRLLIKMTVCMRKTRRGI